MPQQIEKSSRRVPGRGTSNRRGLHPGFIQMLLRFSLLQPLSTRVDFSDFMIFQ